MVVQESNKKAQIQCLERDSAGKEKEKGGQPEYFSLQPDRLAWGLRSMNHKPRASIFGLS